MNAVQKAVAWMLSKAVGFPAWVPGNSWSGSTISDWPGGYGTLNGGLVGGNSVTSSTALNLATVYGCCRIRAGTIGSLPLHLYRDTPQGRVRASDHELYPILHNSPNSFMTSMEWREAMQLGIDLYGNSFSEIGRIGKRVVSLNPLRPDRMQVKNQGGTLQYNYSYDAGKQEILPQEKVLHLRNFSLDGVVGLTPIQRRAVELGISAQCHANAFLRNGGRPSVAFVSPNAAPSPEAQDRLRETAEKMYGGPENAGRMMFTWGGMKPEVLTLSPADAQLLETMKLTDAGIAALYGVPLNMLGHGDKASTYASAEQFDIQFAKHTIRPVAVRWEQSLNKVLFPAGDVYAEFDVDALMRGDSAAQSAFFASAVQNAYMTRNEVRRKLNLPDDPDGDTLTCQSNMVELADLGKLALAATAPTAPPEKSTINVVPEIKTQMDPEQISEFRDEVRDILAKTKTTRKIGKAKRRDDGVMEFEIEERVN